MKEDKSYIEITEGETIQLTEEVLKEKGLEGYVFLMDADTDLGMFVNKDDAKIYYFHPSGYLELAE